MRRGPKNAYVACVHWLRERLGDRGLLTSPETRSSWARWGGSLLAIHDLEELVRLDLPWWTLKATAAVEMHLAVRHDPRVFEWGSGASTVWLSRRSAEVVSVEHDSNWALRVRELAPANVRVELVEPDVHAIPRVPSHKPGFGRLDFSRYVAAIDRDAALYDLIVIDGRAREACLARAMGHLAPGGLIVLDNAERVRYRRAVRRSAQELRVTWSIGATPCLPYPTCTALLSR